MLRVVLGALFFAAVFWVDRNLSALDLESAAWEMFSTVFGMVIGASMVGWFIHIMIGYGEASFLVRFLASLAAIVAGVLLIYILDHEMNPEVVFAGLVCAAVLYHLGFGLWRVIRTPSWRQKLV